MSFYSTMALISKLVSYTAGVSFLLLALLSPRSRKARCYLNTILYMGSMGFCSVFGIVISIILSFVPGQRLNINYYVARTFYALAGSLTGIRFKLEGYEHFAQNQPAVLVGNHQSSMDILYLGAMFPPRTSIMAKKELRFAPLLGQWSKQQP
jgi:lysophosphatidate acyltransferase